MLSTVCYSYQSCQQLVTIEKVWMSSQCKSVPKMTIPVQSQFQPAKLELRSRSISWSHLNTNNIKMKNSTWLLGQCHDKSHLCYSTFLLSVTSVFPTFTLQLWRMVINGKRVKFVSLVLLVGNLEGNLRHPTNPKERVSWLKISLSHVCSHGIYISKLPK